LFTVFDPENMAKCGSRFCVLNIENRKNKKLLAESNEESDRRGDRSSRFIVKKARISV